MKKQPFPIFLLGVLLLLGFSFSGDQVPESMLPLDVLKAIIFEASGELALQNVIFLAGAEKNRLPEEYAKGCYETDFIFRKLKEYGIDEAEVIDLPPGKGLALSSGQEGKIWDADMAELWILSPEKKKLADLGETAASLCPGSVSSDTTAELVFAGRGDEECFYAGQEVAGKIVLVSGYPEPARALAVEKYGAAGIISYGSGFMPSDRSEAALCEVAWSSISPRPGEKPAFAFMISPHAGQELRDQLEGGTRLVARAVCKTQRVPLREQMVSARLVGREYPEEELVFVAHLFEGYHKQAANDNASGCAAILETARVLKNLTLEGAIPPLKRSIRFLFVPEITGTVGYIRKYPEIARRFFAAIDEDMVGSALVKNKAYFILEKSPHSLPSYLNDVMASFFDWVEATQRPADTYFFGPVLPIHSPSGSRDPFYYHEGPFIGGSDHAVFLDGGVRVPSVMFIVWPDLWTHTSGDRPDKSDSTLLKRVVLISAASAAFLASADFDDVVKMISEVSFRGLARVSDEKSRAERLLFSADSGNIHGVFKEAVNIVDQSFSREKEALSSIRLFIRGNRSLGGLLQEKIQGLEEIKGPVLREMRGLYHLRCSTVNLRPIEMRLSKEEDRLNRLVPKRTSRMNGFFDSLEFREKLRTLQNAPAFNLGEAEFEARNFIDGKRTILEIRNALSAEYGPTSLSEIENYFLVLEKLGYIEIRQE